MPRLQPLPTRYGLSKESNAPNRQVEQNRFSRFHLAEAPGIPIARNLRRLASLTHLCLAYSLLQLLWLLHVDKNQLRHQFRLKFSEITKQITQFASSFVCQWSVSKGFEVGTVHSEYCVVGRYPGAATGSVGHCWLVHTTPRLSVHCHASLVSLGDALHRWNHRPNRDGRRRMLVDSYGQFGCHIGCWRYAST